MTRAARLHAGRVAIICGVLLGHGLAVEMLTRGGQRLAKQAETENARSANPSAVSVGSLARVSI